MAEHDKALALEALATLRQHYGSMPICCGGYLPGHPGDGFMQPPDGPECCQCPDRDVNTLCDIIADAMRDAAAPAEARDAADAARYRWLRRSDWYIGPNTFWADEAGGLNDYCDQNLGGPILDAAIDAAMAASSAAKGQA